MQIHKFIFVTDIAMDIVSRIKTFLSEYRIANSQFADKCDIPRPTISQLLNGRNKKVSDEVISKIHSAYPSLSIMWLLFGEEPMLLAPMETNETNETDRDNNQLQFTEDSDDNLFPSADNEFPASKEESNRIVFDTDMSAEKNIVDKPIDDVDFSRTLETFVKNARTKSQYTDNTSTDKNKHIVNVMVFYSDNSFESFIPSR